MKHLLRHTTEGLRPICDSIYYSNKDLTTNSDLVICADCLRFHTETLTEWEEHPIS